MRPSSENKFHTTRWSIVQSVRDSESTVAREALESLCVAYWIPLYSFLRRSGRDPEDAADLVQSFFQDLMTRGDLERIHREGGRFRSWIVKALSNFCRNADAREKAMKRGGNLKVLSLEFENAESRYATEPADEQWGPERLYLRRWALCLLERARERLKEEAQERGREELFTAAAPLLAGGSDAAFLEIGNRMGIAPGTVKVAVHRWRLRLRELIRQEVADTVSREEEVDAELAKLREALS